MKDLHSQDLVTRKGLVRASSKPSGFVVQGFVSHRAGWGTLAHTDRRKP